MKPKLYPFKSRKIPELSEVGGKALSLIHLSKKKFPIPDGFVLAVPFFNPWMKKIKTSASWKKYLKSGEKNLKKNCNAVKKEASKLKLTAAQKKELQTALKKFKKETLFAVRSSSPEEDLEGTSFAGGYETSLGITQENLEKAILHSFTSVFDERIVQYKKQHDIKTDDPQIAVIIQIQVSSETSGVAFSLNPQNNCFDEAVINANFGLGETVVSGQVTPDTYIVDKIKKEILEEKINQKSHALWLMKNGGVKKEKNKKPKKSSLNKTQIKAVTKLTTQVENFFEKPMDIEWAYYQKKLYLLQARPVTAYFPIPEILRTSPGKQKYLYINMGLVKQGLPGVMSTMGASVFGAITNILEDMFPEEVILDPKNGISAFSTGVMVSQVGNMEKMMGKRAMLAAIKIGGQSIIDTYNTIDVKQYTTKKTGELIKKTRRGIVWFALKKVPKMLQAMSGGAEHYLEKYKKQDAHQAKEHQKLFEKQFSSLEDALKESMEINTGSLVDIAAAVIGGARLAKWRLSRMFKHDNVQDLLVNLETALPGNKTAKMGKAMYELAKQPEIQKTKTAETFIKKLKAKTFSKKFMTMWEEYIRLYGFRGMGELDIATPRSYENLPALFSTIKDMSEQVKKRQSSTFERAKKKREAAYQKLKKLAKKKGERSLKKFEKNYQIFLALAGLRENPKYNLIRMMDFVRQEALKFGKALVKAKRIDQPEDIFHLTIAEVDQGLKNKKFNLREQITQNKAYSDRLGGRDVPVFFDSRGKIFHPPVKTVGENEYAGEPIATGKVTGKVKVLHTADEKSILPGEILVAKATDPGWTPLFINAGGIVLEAGGTLQHGAVIAREYGKPCVSSLTKATKIFKDGDLVEVDGSRGIVKVLK